jgi:hypothetical protein
VDCSGYNTPEDAKAILNALKNVDPAAWTEHVGLRRELYGRDSAGLDFEDIVGRVEDDVTWAREAFSTLLAAYSKAVDKGYAVSCEYSL